MVGTVSGWGGTIWWGARPAPDLVGGRMLGGLAEERQRIDAEATREIARRAAREEQLEVIVGAARNLQPLVARGGLVVDVVEVGLAEGAVVKPVVPLPAIDHRTHRHRG